MITAHEPGPFSWLPPMQRDGVTVCPFCQSPYTPDLLSASGQEQERCNVCRGGLSAPPE